jgi:hypothetical protein
MREPRFEGLGVVADQRHARRSSSGIILGPVPSGIRLERLAVFDLPVCGWLRPKLDVVDVRIAVRPLGSRRRFPVFRVLTTRGLLLAPFDERFLAFAFGGGGSSVSGHAALSAYTTDHASRQC